VKVMIMSDERFNGLSPLIWTGTKRIQCSGTSSWPGNRWRAKGRIRAFYWNHTFGTFKINAPQLKVVCPWIIKGCLSETPALHPCSQQAGWFGASPFPRGRQAGLLGLVFTYRFDSV
jgi:hypothetical protein